MPCKICGHTMGRIGTDAVGAALFWCAKCGSTKSDRTPAEAPKIFLALREWFAGISESIGGRPSP
jgi:transposase-like protein